MKKRKKKLKTIKNKEKKRLEAQRELSNKKLLYFKKANHMIMM